MHMTRDEDNAKFRQVIKNTLEFDPEVLKRYVNFMNNPDEKTAAEQFGTTDKYFGVCTMLATLPGLPMFGHGQIEGYREKYGMEYRHAHWDEPIDEGLVKGHEWRIFTLLHRRPLFANVDHFRLYDFYNPPSQSGERKSHVNEDVYAYSNQLGNDRALVLFNNKYAEARGWIKLSAAFMDKSSGSLIQHTISAALSIPIDGYAIFRDYVTRLEYIRSCRDLSENGLYAELGGYQCQVFLDWKFVHGEDWKMIFENLHGAGVPSLDEKYQDLLTPKKITEVTTKKMTRKIPDKPIRRKKQGSKRSSKVTTSSKKRVS
jgi:hypothetical protein